jgi:hypothetical protein
MTDQGTPATERHEIGALRHPDEDERKAGLFGLPLGLIVFLVTVGLARLNMGLWQLGTPQDLHRALVIAIPLALIAGVLGTR